MNALSRDDNLRLFEIVRNPFKVEDPKNGYENMIFDNKEWTVIRRLGEKITNEGFFMRVDIYKVKRKPEKGKTIRGFAVVTEMHTEKDEWNYWVENILKNKGDAELLLEKTIGKVAERFSVQMQYENHIQKIKKSMRRQD